MGNNNNILILYSEVMGYTVAGIRQLVTHYPVTVYLIGWDKGKLTPYIVDLPPNVIYKQRSSFKNFQDLLSYATHVNPLAVFVSGWMDKDYVRVARELKKEGRKSIAFVDNQWSGSFRQLAGSLLAPWFVRRNFNYVWVSGTKQKLFARKMGFGKSEIYSGFYTADTDFFHGVYKERKKFIAQNGYPKNIIFVGRFAEVKNVKQLIEVFIQYQHLWPGWTLTLVGNGPLKAEISGLAGTNKKILIKDFMQPLLLKDDIIKSGVFCLPSIKEPWGVVIHEFASAGVPMIVSDVCGAATDFVEEGNNGFLIKPADKDDLKEKLKKIIDLPETMLLQMGDKSYQLSKKITPSTWANTVMQILGNAETTGIPSDAMAVEN